MVILVFERGVLRADGDAFFPLQVHRVHDPLLSGDRLVGPERPGLLQQAIDQSSLAMVDVRDNRYVSYVLHFAVKKGLKNRP